MQTVWITYSWEDNKEGDIDFIAQELTAFGLVVKLDRWNIHAGKRLWEQIENFICSPTECDAWVFVATQNSLSSEPCKEEYAYALNRALSSRGTFPVIGLFLGHVGDDLIPVGIKTRLYVSVIDSDWKERIKAAAEGRTPDITRSTLEPYHLHVHQLPDDSECKCVIEVRPRAGSWGPFIAAIPVSEKDRASPSIVHGPKGTIPSSCIIGISEGCSPDRFWCYIIGSEEATPTRSYYVQCKELPSRLLFGSAPGTKYIHNFKVSVCRQSNTALDGNYLHLFK